eukprot:3457477-Rhodomonas_salina.1
MTEPQTLPSTADLAQQAAKSQDELIVALRLKLATTKVQLRAMGKVNCNLRRDKDRANEQLRAAVLAANASCLLDAEFLTHSSEACSKMEAEGFPAGIWRMLIKAVALDVLPASHTQTRVIADVARNVWHPPKGWIYSMYS